MGNSNGKISLYEEPGGRIPIAGAVAAAEQAKGHCQSPAKERNHAA